MKNAARTLYLCISAAITLNLSASAQSTTAVAPQQQPADIRVRSKLVVEDVVVTDKNHNPVKNLKLEDFTLIEDKTPQKIGSFEEHTALTAGEAVKFPPMPPIPPGIFTNVTVAPVNSAVNVLLLDALNTPLRDQNYLHEEILRYLNSVHPGTSIAIFGLSTRLVLLQGFTSDPEVLRKAAQKQIGHASPMLADAIGGGSTESISELATAMGIPTAAGTAASLEFFDTQTSSGSLDQRTRLTLDAINILARYLASIPGRKNLVWFAGSFPLDLTAGINAGNFTNPFLDAPGGESEYRETVNLLAHSQVAVYPISSGGLATQGFEASSSVSLARKSVGGGSGATEAAADHQTMERIAKDTGGHAYYNVNDLSHSLDSALSEGSNYYTITYTPTNSEWKNDFRKIEVKTDLKDVELAYRHGYYATNPDARDSAFTNGPPTGMELTPLRKAMIHGVPGPTEILFKVRVTPVKGVDDKPAQNNEYTPVGRSEAKGSFRRYIVEFDALGHNFTFIPTPDGKFHTKAQFGVIVYQQDGKVEDTVSTTFVDDITAAAHASILHSGFPFRLEISVPNRGEHTLRIGVYDFNSGHVGSLELPLAAVANLPPVDVPMKTFTLHPSSQPTK